MYRKVPRDLTDATHLGGVISLVCAALMAYLFISNIMEYMRTTTTTDVALDETGETTMRVYFNITMVCRGHARSIGPSPLRFSAQTMPAENPHRVSTAVA